MFEVGFTEIVLILGIALLVLGPEKLPKLANQVGRWAGRARAMARQLRQQLDEEVTIVSKDDFSLTPRSPAATQAAAPSRPNPAPDPSPSPPPPPPPAEKTEDSSPPQ